MQEVYTSLDLSSTFEHYVALAADDVTRLHFCDVARVMQQAIDVDELCSLSEYLLNARPDFDVAEIIEIEATIIAERGWQVTRERLSSRFT